MAKSDCVLKLNVGGGGGLREKSRKGQRSGKERGRKGERKENQT